MQHINVLDSETINKIAAGEVVERPSSVVKELVENAIDAGATAITVEIKDGGISFIRVTDNGGGIEKDDIAVAFLRHSTSKIRSAQDLLVVSSLGFRGEALSSIASVSQVELVTKTSADLTGIQYRIEGGVEKSVEEIGCPSGTTMIVRNLFYNTPARRKFLKSPMTEAGYVNDLLMRLALSHPEISFKFINNRQNRIHTAGNMRLKDIIYNIYGRDITANVIEIQNRSASMEICGFVGKPLISRGNRAYENYFINGRYIKSPVITKAIEEAYKNFVMVHKYPFTAFHLKIDSSFIDVNVHPTKMEIRFNNSEEVYELVYRTIRDVLEGRELIPDVSLDTDAQIKQHQREEQNARFKTPVPEPFEYKRREHLKEDEYKHRDHLKENEYNSGEQLKENTNSYPLFAKQNISQMEKERVWPVIEKSETSTVEPPAAIGEQLELFDDRLLTRQARERHRLIGQIFETYWLVEYDKKLFIIDQHAAHEKVIFEKLKKHFEASSPVSQLLDPPLILTLSLHEEEALNKYSEAFKKFGFEIEHFGGREYAVRAVPSELYGFTQRDLFIDLLDSITVESGHLTADIINERIAGMACKAAVKGNHRMSPAEADALIDELLKAENPYNCPHGRPTIIAMSQYELEKKFKRIQ